MTLGRLDPNQANTPQFSQQVTGENTATLYKYLAESMGFELCVLRILKDLLDTVSHCPLERKVDHWPSSYLQKKSLNILLPNLVENNENLTLFPALLGYFAILRWWAEINWRTSLIVTMGTELIG